VGIACTFPVFGALIDWFDWQVAFLISGTFTALLALGWAAYGSNHPWEHRSVNEVEQRLIDRDKTNHQPHQIAGSADSPQIASAAVHGSEPMLQRNTDGPDWRSLLGNRSLMLLTVSYAALGYFEYVFFFWMHYYFKEELKLGTNESRVYAAVLLVAMAGGMVLGGWAADRLRMILGSDKGRGLVPVLGMCAGGILLVLGLLAQETAWIVTLLALALAAVGAVEAPVWTMAIELGGRQGGTAAGICNTGGNAGGLVGPILAPLVSGWIGWQWGISLGSLIAVLGAVLWYWITPAESQDSWSRS
jgi:MFS family permease